MAKSWPRRASSCARGRVCEKKVLTRRTRRLRGGRGGVRCLGDFCASSAASALSLFAARARCTAGLGWRGGAQGSHHGGRVRRDHAQQGRGWARRAAAALLILAQGVDGEAETPGKRGLAEAEKTTGLFRAPRRHPHGNSTRDKRETLATRLEGAADPPGEPQLGRSLRSPVGLKDVDGRHRGRP